VVLYRSEFVKTLQVAAVNVSVPPSPAGLFAVRGEQVSELPVCTQNARVVDD
jgi:hypothetical protein